MTRTLRIDGQLPGLNQLLAAKRRVFHRQDGYGQIKASWETAIAAIALDQGVLPVTRPVDVHFQWVLADRRRDPDNVAGAGQKLILDGLVAARVLPGDGCRWIRSLAHTFDVGSPPCVLVTLSECGA